MLSVSQGQYMLSLPQTHVQGHMHIMQILPVFLLGAVHACLLSDPCTRSDCKSCRFLTTCMFSVGSSTCFPSFGLMHPVRLHLRQTVSVHGCFFQQQSAGCVKTGRRESDTQQAHGVAVS